jgi:hypothetical protein
MDIKEERILTARMMNLSGDLILKVLEKQQDTALVEAISCFRSGGKPEELVSFIARLSELENIKSKIKRDANIGNKEIARIEQNC